MTKKKTSYKKKAEQVKKKRTKKVFLCFPTRVITVGKRKEVKAYVRLVWGTRQVISSF